MGKCLACVILILFALFNLQAQETSKKQEIALFSISSATQLNQSLIEEIDAMIKEVFIKMKRFKIIGFDFRSQTNDIDSFLEKIRKMKKSSGAMNAENSKSEVQTGEKFLTIEEVNQVINSYIIVIPRILNHNVERIVNGQVKASFTITFSILKADTLDPIPDGIINLTLSGEDRNANSASQSAIQSLVLNLTYKLRNIETFKLKTGVIEIKNNQVFLELGGDMGIEVGDEFYLEDISDFNGFTYKKEKALLIIKEVQEKFCIAEIQYASEGSPYVGQSAQELPRLGFDFEFYTNYVLANGSGASYNFWSFGLKTVATRGLYCFRPMVALDFPLIYNFSNIFWLPVNLFLGFEFDLVRWQRLQLTFDLALGMGSVYIPWDTEKLFGSNAARPFYIANLGFRSDFKLMVLLGRDVKLTASAGVGGFLSISNDFLGNYHAFFKNNFQIPITAGLLFKL